MTNLWDERNRIINDHSMPEIIDFVKWNNGISIALLIFSSSLIKNDSILFLKIILTFIYILLFISIFTGIAFVSLSLDIEKSKRVYNHAKDKLNSPNNEASEVDAIKAQINVFEQRIHEWQDSMLRRYLVMSIAQMLSFFGTNIGYNKNFFKIDCFKMI